MHTEDLLYVIRNDRKKFARVDELLEMNAKLKDARRNFDLHDPAAVLAQRADEDAARRRRAEARGPRPRVRVRVRVRVRRSNDRSFVLFAP